VRDRSEKPGPYSKKAIALGLAFYYRGVPIAIGIVAYSPTPVVDPEVKIPHQKIFNFNIAG
jgi:hypothetical protein